MTKEQAPVGQNVNLIHTLRRNVPAVLIVGQRPDPHIDAVRDVLLEWEINAVVLDRHGEDSLTVHCSREDTRINGCIATANVNFECVRSVWWRVKPAVPSEFPGGSASREEAFRWHEWKAFLNGLPFLLPQAKWVNPMRSHIEVSTKLRQLALATAVGLDIPHTVITNSVADCLPLFEKYGRVIYKTLSSFLVPPDAIIFTTEVAREQVMSEASSITLAPCIFQEYIEKDHELRVTIVGDSVFTVMINSQGARETAIDWRRDQCRNMYQQGNLRDETKSCLLEFQHRAGLLYGAYDLIVSKDGRDVFLECNPGGQWLWLERATGCPISREVAKLLATV